MRTAIDTNVLSAFWSGERTADTIAAALRNAKTEGDLVLSGVAYAELFAHPNATEPFLRDFLLRTHIQLDFLLEEQTFVEAGKRFSEYAIRRRRSMQGQSPRRLLADYLIGAHALLHADRLMTLDTRIYRQDFPELMLVSLWP